MHDNIKICLISSHGGHLRELLNATENVVAKKYYVTHKTRHTVDILNNYDHYFILDPHTSFLKYIINVFQSLYHIVRERPAVVISTGAGIAIPTLFICKYLIKSKIIFIESAANVLNPTRTGMLLYPRSDLFLIQWPELKSFYPNAKYIGLV